MLSNIPHSQRAARRIIKLALVILAIVLAGGLAALAYTARSVDRVQVEEERLLVSGRIERTLGQIVTDISSASVGDDAYERLGPEIDRTWADENIGRYYAKYLHHDLSLIFDGRDRPVYAWRGEGRIAPDAVATFARDVAPLLARVRSEEQARTAGGVGKPYGLEAELTTRSVVVSGGKFFLVGATSVTAETAGPARRPGPMSIIVSARRMDGAFLVDMENNLRIFEPRIVPPSVAPTQASTAIVDANGFVAGSLAWTQKRPGQKVLRDAAPIFVLAFLVLLASGGAMAISIRAILRDLAAGDAALDRTMSLLVRARDQADTANIAKSQFLANMSHEIRTPLNGVLGMAQVMARDELTPAQADRLNIIRASGQTLLCVLNDVLDISKIEAGRLDIEAHEFDLGETVNGACAAFANLAAQKDVDLMVDIAPDAEGIWWGDSARLRQVIANLVSNAVKFSAEGVVTVSVAPAARGLTFSVRDAGIGIPLERLGDLFQKFSQVDASTSRRFGGTGLGLAICRELVELMGGQIGATSAPGEGSIFSFTLPLEKRAEARAQAALSTKPAAETFVARILAAEDNATNQLILKSLLEPLGVDLTVVSNGREAVDAVQTQTFDLVLMDVQMPEMNGVEATMAIRALEAQRGQTPLPILALSANVMRHQMTEYLAAGMTGFVPKPIEAARLFAAIDEALSSPDETAGASANDAAAAA